MALSYADGKEANESFVSERIGQLCTFSCTIDSMLLLWIMREIKVATLSVLHSRSFASAEQSARAFGCSGSTAHMIEAVCRGRKYPRKTRSTSSSTNKRDIIRHGDHMEQNLACSQFAQWERTLKVRQMTELSL